jgi:hypothetical protein
MKVIFGLFLSIAVAPGVVLSFTLAHSVVPARRTSSLNMVTATLGLENSISPDDEVSLSDGGMTVGALCKDVASHVDNVLAHPFC